MGFDSGRMGSAVCRGTSCIVGNWHEAHDKIPIMFTRLISRKALSCWLVAALLLQALMPAMAGVRTGDGTRWAEVCFSSGVKWVPISDASDPQVSHVAADHCVLCAATGAAPEFDAGSYLSDLASDSPSLRRDRTPVLILSVFQRQPRAPPR